MIGVTMPARHHDMAAAAAVAVVGKVGRAVVLGRVVMCDSVTRPRNEETQA